MLYDYRNDDLVQDVILESVEDIVDDIVEEYVGLRRNDYLAVYVPVSIATKILYILMDERLDSLYINDEAELELLEDNSNVVIITIGFDGSVDVEEAYGYENIKHTDAVLTYFYDGLSQKDLEVVKELNEYCDCIEHSILVFGFEEDESEDELDMEIVVSTGKDGVPHGFSATWADECEKGHACYQSYSVYSTCPTRVIELADIFGIEL